MEYIIVGLGLDVVVWVFANSRGRCGFCWFVVGLLVTPLVAGLLVLVLPRKAPPFRRLLDDPQMPRRRIEPYLTIAAMLLGLAGPAMAAPPDWYIAVTRFNSCDPVSSHFKGLHTPEQVQDLYRRIGTTYNIDHPTPTVTFLVDAFNENSRIVFFVHRAACEAEMAKNAHFYDHTDIPLPGHKSD